jgi:hypothetical protein
MLYRRLHRVFSEMLMLIVSIVSRDNKHRNACCEHGDCGNRDNDPSQTETRLALHQLLVGSNDHDCNEEEGRKQPVNYSCQYSAFIGLIPIKSNRTPTLVELTIRA